MSERQPGDDLQWTAFRYVAGDLPVAEAERFESQLADDPDACDAVAEQVALTAAVAAALRPQPVATGPDAVPDADRGTRRAPAPTVAPPRRAARLGWIALAAAACVAVSVLYQGFDRGASTERPADPSAVDIERLAAAWSESVDNWSAVEGAIPSLGDDEVDAHDLLAEIATVAAPDWMKAAVADLDGNVPFPGQPLHGM